MLIFTEACSSRVEARKKEKYWKGGSENKKLKMLIIANGCLYTDI
jgi:hypothetical protein